MNSIDHFSYYLGKYPDCRVSLELICKQWKKNGRLPARIVLCIQILFIEEGLTEIFGPGALHLSKNGSITLITDRLFELPTEENKELWIRAVHHACGIPFEKASQPEDTVSALATAINRWRLIFPELAQVADILYCSRGKGLSIDEQLELWIQAGTIVTFLRENTDVLTVSDLGAQFCGNSKALRGGELILLVTDWLTFLDTGMQITSNEIDSKQRKTVRRETLERHGIVENRCSVAVTVFGPLVFEKYGQRIEYVKNLWNMGESALLSLENLDGIEKIEVPDGCQIYTCENESPFANMVRKKHQGLIIYTRGFPNSAVCKLYRLILQHDPKIACFHWGDTDFAGLQIASILNRIAPLRLWRCDKDVIEKNRSSLISISNEAKVQIRRFLENNSNFPFREELELTCKYGWFEQERFKG